jgi:hypothetical protein
MPKIRYQDINLGAVKLAVIKQANDIIAEYQQQGFDLTLRQLYYQFVARDLIPNRVQEYKRLGDIINDGRLAGLVDWNAIVDRTRNLESLSHWKNPAAIVQAVSEQYNVDRWAGQPNRVEVWIEKDALVGVIERVCEELDVPYFSCRGYTSQSEMWSAAQRMMRYQGRVKVKPGQKKPEAQTPIILHFGDHDPSGIDMTRDIQDRLSMFMGGTEIRRLALNMDQVEKYDPPPNPAKTTDSRYRGYMEIHGHESWELDALEPSVLVALIRREIEDLIEPDAWQEAEERQQEGREQLGVIADRYDDVIRRLED